jgi:serine/threonine protein kinase/tetratricopeptide (TPR) repeat protein
MASMVGPFRLDEPLARGGMSEVWLGAHAPPSASAAVHSETRVAIKVLVGHEALSRSGREAFQDEVRAAARLLHPSITMILDHGEISAETAAQSNGALFEHSPWIAMEHSSGGTLGRFRSALPYPRLQAILLALLDALGHAHARGVIHRDVKPGNVLLAGPDDVRPGLKLTDFGIAHALHRHHLRNAKMERAGTLHYMAPEQILGEWRDHGPWTDLYAMGCLGWRIATGRPPFAGRKDGDLSLAQLEEEPPAFEPLTDMAEGFEPWLRRLLVKDPQGRFLTCADAARALMSLGSPEPSWDNEDDPALELLRPPPIDSWSEDDLPTLQSPEVLGEIVSSQRKIVVETTIPDTWGRPGLDSAPLPLLDAGLGLYGLRTIPFVGRERERDQLWATLRTAAEQRTIAVALVTGAAGVGKSRLVEWLVQRVAELGSATVLQAVHEANDGPGEPIRRMLERFLVSTGLDHDGVHDRTQRVLGPWGVEADEMAGLAQLLAPTPDSRVQLASATDRRALVIRCVERMSKVRPVLVWLEDAAWGADALAFARALLDRRDTAPMPVLVLITARSETIAVRDAERTELNAIASREGVTNIVLGPLPSNASRDLIHKLLRLDATLAARLEERAAGNPSFMVQVVGDWVQRGVLDPTPSGFALRPGEPLAVPHDLASVWHERVTHLLHDVEAGDAAALERAATLGTAVDSEEWAAVCEGTTPVGSADGRVSVVTRLLESSLASLTSTGWVFAHGMLRDALLARAGVGGRAIAHHLACAAMLAQRWTEGRPHLAERLGHHLLQGGQPSQALAPLMSGVRERERTVGFGPALSLMVEVEAALDVMVVSAEDPRRLAAAAERARLRFETGDLDGAVADAERTAATATLTGHDELARQARLWRLKALRVAHGPEHAGADVDELIGDATAHDDRPVLAAALYERALVLRARTEIDRADAALRAARALFLDVDDEAGAVACLRKLADHEKSRGNLQGAREAYLDILQAYTKLGDRGGAAQVQNGLGEVARQLGNLDEAELWYHRALEGFESVGGLNRVVPRFNLGLVLMAQGRWTQALNCFEGVRPMTERFGMRPFIAAIHAAVVPCLAATGEWRRFDAHLATAAELLEGQGAVDDDIAAAMSLAAEVAAEAEEPERADAAARLAIEYWTALDVPAEVRRARQWLHRG